MPEEIWYELKKIFYYRIGIVFFVLFILLKTVFLILSDVPANKQMEEEKTTYISLLETVAGSLTEEKTNWITQTAAAAASAESIVQTAYSQYYEGILTETQMHEKVDSQLVLLEKRGGFDTVYQQFLYVRQDPERRYFLYTNGWDALLSPNTPDYLLILLLFLLLAPIYCEESKNQMDWLTVTMKHGGLRLSRYKLFAAAAIVLSLSICSFAIETMFCAVKYGLPCGSFPMQSLSCFSSSAKMLTLSQAACSIFGLRVLGCFCLGAMILSGTVLFRRYAPTLLVCIAAVMLPAWGLSPSLRHLFPGPAALLTASGYLMGTKTEASDMTGGEIIVFQEIDGEYLLFLLIMDVLFCAGMIWMLQRQCTNQWMKSHRAWCRQIACLLLAGIMMLSLSGCSPVHEKKTDVFNLSDVGSCETEQYLVYIDYDEDQNQILTAKDKESGKCTQLVRDPFQVSGDVMDYLYGSGSYVYYIRMTDDKSESIMYVMYEQLLVQEVDLRDFSERTIFRADLNEKNLLGTAFAADRTDLTFYLDTLGFFVDEQYLYFIATDSISRVHRITGKREKLIETLVIADAAYDGEYLYYLNEKSELVQYSIAEEAGCIVPDIIAKRFYLYGDTLYFQNRKDKEAIYKWSRTDDTVSKLCVRALPDAKAGYMQNAAKKWGLQ